MRAGLCRCLLSAAVGHPGWWITVQKTALGGFFKTKNNLPKGQNCLHQELILDCFRKITRLYLSMTQYTYLWGEKTILFSLKQISGYRIRTKMINCSWFVVFFSLPGRPCVDCHAFEFMQRALQDLKKTAFNLDTRVKMWRFSVMRRCDRVGQFLRLPIWPKIHSIPANTLQRLPSTTNNGNKMLFILSSFACFSKKKKYWKSNTQTWYQANWCEVTVLFCPLQTEMLVLRAERRALCDCMTTNSLRWRTPRPSHLSSRSVPPHHPPPPHPWNLFIRSHLTTRHFIFFPL